MSVREQFGKLRRETGISQEELTRDLPPPEGERLILQGLVALRRRYRQDKPAQEGP